MGYHVANKLVAQTGTVFFLSGPTIKTVSDTEKKAIWIFSATTSNKYRIKVPFSNSTVVFIITVVEVKSIRPNL